jgi:hypothetical protein
MSLGATAWTKGAFGSGSVSSRIHEVWAWASALERGWSPSHVRMSFSPLSGWCPLKSKFWGPSAP